jgi:hypothetical protein
VALDQLTDQLVAAVNETMQPTQVGLWVRNGPRQKTGGGAA